LSDESTIGSAGGGGTSNLRLPVVNTRGAPSWASLRASSFSWARQRSMLDRSAAAVRPNIFQRSKERFERRPLIRTSGMPIHSGMPAAHRKPSRLLARPAIDSTDRSISPAMITRVIGKAMIATSMRAATRFEKLPAVRKNGDKALPRTMSPARATTSRTSQRNRPRVQDRRSVCAVIVPVIGRAARSWPAGPGAG